MHIFTSPSSASDANEPRKYIEDSAEEENIDPSAALELPRKKRKKTGGQPKGSVAAKRGICHATPRMIAYAAVQVRGYGKHQSVYTYLAATFQSF